MHMHRLGLIMIMTIDHQILRVNYAPQLGTVVVLLLVESLWLLASMVALQYRKNSYCLLVDAMRKSRQKQARSHPSRNSYLTHHDAARQHANLVLVE